MSRLAWLGSKSLKKLIEFGHLKEMTHAYLWGTKKNFALGLEILRTGPVTKLLTSLLAKFLLGLY